MKTPSRGGYCAEGTHTTQVHCRAGTRRSPNVVLMLATVFDGEPTLKQHWVNISWLQGETLISADATNTSWSMPRISLTELDSPWKRKWRGEWLFGNVMIWFAWIAQSRTVIAFFITKTKRSNCLLKRCAVAAVCLCTLVFLSHTEVIGRRILFSEILAHLCCCEKSNDSSSLVEWAATVFWLCMTVYVGDGIWRNG